MSTGSYCVCVHGVDWHRMSWQIVPSNYTSCCRMGYMLIIHYSKLHKWLPNDCLLNHLFRRSSKKTSMFRVTGLCAGNSPVTREFPAQRTSNAENISIWWRHHGLSDCKLSHHWFRWRRVLVTANEPSTQSYSSINNTSAWWCSIWDLTSGVPCNHVNQAISGKVTAPH